MFIKTNVDYSSVLKEVLVFEGWVHLNDLGTAVMLSLSMAFSLAESCAHFGCSAQRMNFFISHPHVLADLSMKCDVGV